MKKFKNIIFTLAAMLCLPVFVLNTTAQSTGGEIPVESYTYWEDLGVGDRKAVYTQATHFVKKIISADTLGIEALNSISDICTDSSGRVYILDSGASKVVILNSEYDVINIIDSVNGNDNYDFTGAKGIFVSNDAYVYISDTENQRVLVCDINGNLKNIITVPDSPLIPSDFQFMPICVSVDSVGYTYVLCDGSYYGALMYSSEGEFLGFYGANKVKNTDRKSVV